MDGPLVRRSSPWLEAMVTPATSNGKTTAIHSKRKDLANHQSTVFPEGVLPSGEYALPFQWAAPVDAPASFNLNFRGATEAYVKHRIKVRVSSTSFLSRDSRYEHVFQVYQPSIPVSAYVQMDHPVSNYCCIPSGNVFMSLSLPTNTVFPGETITAAVKLDASQCRSKSATAIFQLKQKLKLDAHGSVFRQSKVVSQWSGNILAAGEIYEKIKILAVPNDLQCSLNTREIHCQYFLTINLDYGLLQKKKLSAEVIVGAPLQVNSGRPHYLPGDVITGTVAFHAASPIKHDGIYIRLGNAILANWKVKTQNGSSEAGFRIDIGNYETKMYPEGVLPQGNHVVPFQWSVPDDAVSSFFYRQNSSSLKAYVKYRIKVSVASGSFLSYDDRFEHQFLVHQPQVPRPVYELAEKPITKYWCFYYGKVSVAV